MGGIGLKKKTIYIVEVGKSPETGMQQFSLNIPRNNVALYVNRPERCMYISLLDTIREVYKEISYW